MYKTSSYIPEVSAERLNVKSIYPYEYQRNKLKKQRIIEEKKVRKNYLEKTLK